MRLFFFLSVRTLTVLMAGQLVNGKLDSIRKEAVMDNSSYYPGI
jgi:hypothetical protein